MKFLETFAKSMSGSIGGITASHNRFGSYLRGRTIGVNPNSDRQQLVRSIFAALSHDWSNLLTPANRAAWNLYASNVAFKDALGQDIYLTGYNHFIRTNTVALLAAVPQVNGGPTIFTLADQDPAMTPTVDEAQQEISVVFDDTMAWLDEDGACMQISMSRPANVGIIYIPPVSRVAGYILGNGTTPPTTPATMDVPFPVAETNRVIVTGRILMADGRLSGEFQKSTDVTA